MAVVCIPHGDGLQAKIKSLLGAPTAPTEPTETIDLTAGESPESSFRQELMAVDHQQLAEELAKYKLLNEHLDARLTRLEGDANTRSWPLVLLHGTSNGQTPQKVEIICHITSEDDSEYGFSRL